MMSKFPHAAVVDGKQHDRFVIINIQQDRSLITLFLKTILYIVSFKMKNVCAKTVCSSLRSQVQKSRFLD